ncbi:MAG: hypothetical protein KF847_14935 [Pirellulales bacterium]|nr:hypothetical protein [Pirellulales bacterium]
MAVDSDTIVAKADQFPPAWHALVRAGIETCRETMAARPLDQRIGPSGEQHGDLPSSSWLDERPSLSKTEALGAKPG